MRKQARRLWFGDWQRHDEPAPAERVAGGPDESDTVMITPVDEGDAKWRAERRRNIGRGAAGLAALAVLVALGFRLAGGHDAKPTPVTAQTPPAQTPQAQPQVPQVPQGAPPGGFGGADLTGAAATKAAEAAVAKYPGDVERVTAGPGGGYVVHVIQADGNEVHVLVDEGFKVQGSDAGAGPRGFGSGTSQ